MKYIKEILPYVIIIVVVALIRLFLVTPVRVTGDSMRPNLKDKQILILNKINKKYKRFDIVVIQYNDERIIKRIIGLPGEFIEYKENKLYVNHKKIKEPFKHYKTEDFDLYEVPKYNHRIIPKDYYLVLGDNRVNSTDSRIIGLINKKDIKGSVNLRIFPLNKIGSLK